MFFAQFEVDVKYFIYRRIVKTSSIVNIQYYQSQLTMTWKIDNIKNNNWHCLCLQICWIKFFLKMINIFWLFLIYSSLLSISMSLLLKETNSFARNWYWFQTQRMSKFNEFYSMSINELRRKFSLSLYMIMNTIWNNCFFLNDSNETNKIFVQNIVMNKFRSKKIIVFVVISFDITIILLNDDSTAHIRFKKILNFNVYNFCDIFKKFDRVNFIQKIKLIFWNESFMQRKYDMLIVNRIISNMCSFIDVHEQIFFDDKIVCFCDDFKQILFVCSNMNRNDIVRSCIQIISFWKNIYILRLTINMRFQNRTLNKKNRFAVVNFAREIIESDNAITTIIQNDDDKENISWNHEFIENNSQLNLIKTLYFDFEIRFSNIEYLKQRIILAIINVDVDVINNICVNRLFDSINNKFNFNRVVDSKMIEEFSSKCFHRYDETSLSFCIFRLKMNMFIMLFRNIKSFVMCNETRIRLIRIIVSVFEIEIIVNKSIDERILISRISLNLKNDEINKNRKKFVSCQFIRRQFSIRFAFVIIINKSQNQSLRYVDIDIQIRECFTHEQFYVIVFRITKMNNLYIIISKNDFVNMFKLIRNIQWTKILLSF